MLSKEELINVQGGAIKASIVASIGSGIVFIIGFISGITRPYTCYSNK